MNAFDLLILGFLVVLTIGGFSLRVHYGLQAVTALVPSLMHTGAQFPLKSLSRYALAAFPCFIVLAIHVGKIPRFVQVLLLALSSSLLLLLSRQFIRGFWVG